MAKQIVHLSKKLFFALFLLHAMHIQAAEPSPILFKVNLPESCFDADSITKFHTELAGEPGFFLTFRLLPECARYALTGLVTGNEGESFSGIHTVTEDEYVSDTLLFCCDEPTRIYSQPNTTSVIFLNKRGESESMAYRDVKVVFAESIDSTVPRATEDN